jgi:hypothetical protein
MIRFGVVALILLALSTAAWLWLENRRLRTEEFSPDVPAVVITLDSYPCNVQIVMKDLKQVEALISQPMMRGVKVPAGVSFKKLGHVQIRGDKVPIRLFWPVGAFEASDGIHKADFSGLEEMMKESLKRANASF